MKSDALKAEKITRVRFHRSKAGESRVLSTYAAQILLLKIFSALLQQTAYVPDEFYQSTDVVHNFILNETSVTWEWKSPPIRSPIWLLPILVLGKCLDWIGFYRFVNLHTIMRLYVALASGISEISFLKFIDRSFNSSAITEGAFLLMSLSFHQLFASSRPISNSMELALFTFTLSYFSEDHLKSSSTTYLYPAALSIIMRPTSATFYIPLFLLHLFHSEDRVGLLAKSVKMTVFIFALCIGIDSLWFGEYTITPFNFLKINVFDNIAVFYGRNGFFGWYLVQGLPISCGFSCVFAAFGLFSSERLSKLEKGLLITLIFNWFILEIGSEHKEFRFIMSALPILTLFGAKSAARAFQNEWLKKIYVGLNLLIGIYLSMVHQRGPGDLARYLRVELCFNEDASIRFYGPCHVMPGEYSRFCLKGNHLDISQLECPPPISQDGENQPYKTDVDKFHEDPEDFVYKDLTRKSYDYLAFFDKHEPSLRNTLQELRYFHVETFFHSPTPLDDASRSIVLYKLRK